MRQAGVAHARPVEVQPDEVLQPGEPSQAVVADGRLLEREVGHRREAGELVEVAILDLGSIEVHFHDGPLAFEDRAADSPQFRDLVRLVRCDGPGVRSIFRADRLRIIHLAMSTIRLDCRHRMGPEGRDAANGRHDQNETRPSDHVAFTPGAIDATIARSFRTSARLIIPAGLATGRAMSELPRATLIGKSQ